MQAFTVGGTGEFPVDMLRYDEAFPATSADASAIALRTDDLRANESRRVVRLLTHRRLGPTLGRWQSFGWCVLSHKNDFGICMSDDDIAKAEQTFLAGRRAPVLLGGICP